MPSATSAFRDFPVSGWPDVCPALHRIEPSATRARRERIQALGCGTSTQIELPAAQQAAADAAAAIAHSLNTRGTLCDASHPCNATLSSDGLFLQVTLPPRVVVCCEPHGERWEQIGVRVEPPSRSTGLAFKFRLATLARWWCARQSSEAFLQTSRELRPYPTINRLLLLKPRPTVYYRGSWHPLPTSTPGLRELIQTHVRSFHHLLDQMTALGERQRARRPQSSERLRDAGLRVARRSKHSRCAVVWSGFDLLCSSGRGLGSEIDSHDAVWRSGVTQAFSRFSRRQVGRLADVKLTGSRVQDHWRAGRRTTYRMDGPLDLCVEPSLSENAWEHSTCVVSSSWFRQGWLSERSTARQLSFPCCGGRHHFNVSVPKLLFAVERSRTSLAFAREEPIDDLDTSELPGLDAMNAEEGEGRALMSSLAACQAVTVFGAGLLHLPSVTTASSSSASSASAREAMARAPHEISSARFYDPTASHCTPNTTENWRLLQASKSSRERLQKRGIAWAHGRLSKEVFLHLLHAFGIITWRQAGHVGVQEDEARMAKARKPSDDVIMPLEDAPLRSDLHSTTLPSSSATLADVQMAKIRDRSRAMAGGSYPSDAQAAFDAAADPIVRAEEHLVLPIAGGPFAVYLPRYFTLLQPSANPAVLERWLSDGGNRRSGAKNLKLPRWAKPWAHSFANGSLMLLARTGSDVYKYGTQLFCVRRALVAPQSATPVAPTIAAQEYEPEPLVQPLVVIHSHTVSHNLAATFVHGGRTNRGPTVTLLAVGGQSKTRRSRPEVEGGWSHSHNKGIFVLNASSLLDVVSQKWFAYQRHDEILTSAALSGSHPGCVENRQEFGRHCEFDGRLSVVQHRSRFLIFARANLKASGGRFVQVATSRADDPSSSGYGPFKLLNIAGYDPLGPGNVYVASVKPLPIVTRPAMLLGLFAVNLGKAAQDETNNGALSHGHRIKLDDGNTDGKSFIGLALSCNGRDWSEFIPVINSTGAFGRTFDHPVDGLLLNEGPGERRTVSIVVQRDVFDISPAANDHSRLVRKEIRMDALARLAKHVSAGLSGCS